MMRRIAAAGLGGVAGLVLWCYFADPLGRDAAARTERERTRAMKTTLFSAAVATFCGGAIALFGGQFLRIVPTQEQVDKQSRPLSLMDRNKS
jgi:hypothetical protein